MALTSGPTITAPVLGEVLVERTFPTARTVRVGVILTSSYNFDGLFEVWDGAGAVIYDLGLPVMPPALILSNLGPINVPQNGRIRVITRNTLVVPGVLEVQATLDIRDWAER